MALDKMGLHLAHRVENDADDNQQTGAAEELRRDVRNIQACAKSCGRIAMIVRKIAPAKVSRVIV